MRSFWLLFLIICGHANCHLTTDVLWESCESKICGKPKLNIQCDKNTIIMINKATSGLGKLYDQQSYQNLRRMCMGMAMCDTTRFCEQHRSAPYFNVSYTCVREFDIDSSCEEGGRDITNTKGFIISPNYPAEVSRFRRCRWRIEVPPEHYVHIFLHDIQSTMSSDKCDGLIFMARDTCGMPFPTFAVCDDSRMNSTISACSTTQILLAMANQSMRFWLSYYVLPVSHLSYASLYDVGITCVVTGKSQFAYSQAYFERNKTVTNVSDTEVEPETVDKSTKEEDDSPAAYIGIAVGTALCIILIVIVIICVKRRRDAQQSQMKNSESMSNSNSQNEIQKRPLPERQETGEYGDENEAKLQIDYSVVADEVPRVPLPLTSPTYAEIEEYSDNSLKPKQKLIQKKSIDSSVRELPAKPKEEPNTSVYTEIDDADAKDAETEKSSTVKAKNKKNEEVYNPDYEIKKKMSVASNIYAECADVTDEKGKPKGKDKPKSSEYMDMSHKTFENKPYLTRSKNNKDRANISKRSQVTNQGVSDADKTKAPAEIGKNASKAKNESVTSDSDSDDDIYIVENELYEPFESAKV